MAPKKILAIAPIKFNQQIYDSIVLELNGIVKGVEAELFETIVAMLPEGGPVSIENFEQEAQAVPYVLDVAKEYAGKVDAIITLCMADPGAQYLRAIYPSTPIIGAAQSAYTVAQINLVNPTSKYSVVTTQKETVPLVQSVVDMYQVNNRVASIRYVSMDVIDITNPENREKLIVALTEQSVEAVKLDGAKQIILGCTGMMGVAEELEKRLNDTLKPENKIVVVDPTVAAIAVSEMMIKMQERQ
ncbi:hypothetical protein ABK040_004900 [Willaertia magna]